MKELSDLGSHDASMIDFKLDNALLSILTIIKTISIKCNQLPGLYLKRYKELKYQN